MTQMLMQEVGEEPRSWRSCTDSQDEILRAIQALHCPDGFECDMTYGNGAFWRNLSMTFSYQLRNERKRLGLTLAGLASALDVGQRTIDHWLAGDRVPLKITQEGALARLASIKTPRKKSNNEL